MNLAAKPVKRTVASVRARAGLRGRAAGPHGRAVRVACGARRDRAGDAARPARFYSQQKAYSPGSQAKPVAPVASLRETVGKAAAAAVLAACLAMPEAAFAKDVQPYAGLTPCKSNAAFAKREKAELKGLGKRAAKARPRGSAAQREARRAAQRGAPPDQP